MGNLVRVISESGGIILTAIDTTKMVNEAEKIHKSSAVVTAAMGRLVTASSMMGVMLKEGKNSVTLRVDGGGAIGTMIAVSDGFGNARVYVQNPIVEIPLNTIGKLDVGAAVGTNGFLTVIKDIGLKEPYIGKIKLVSGEIAEDITNYYAISEQIPTVCGLGVLVNPNLSVKHAGGFLVQLLPGATNEEITYLENNIATLPSVTQMMAEGKSPLDMANIVLDGFNPSVLDESEVFYKCNCSIDRVKNALISMGKQELLSMAEEQPETEVCCHFCSNKYHFTKKDIIDLAEESSK
ncbi:MAG: Hsp33 family molecular chaperone HslO [Oscillospiraceae bacterium]